MSGVQEEADSLINIAYAHIRIGNLTKAQEFAEKAEKLLPSDKVIRLKIEIANKRKNYSSSQRKFNQEHLDAVNQVINCKTLYEMLQVNRYSSDTDIRKAFKRIALILHPDKNHVSGAEEAFKDASNALKCLTKPINRRIYNSFLDTVAFESFYGHDASHYPPKWWCDASDKSIEEMEWCLSLGYGCQNADCEGQRKNKQQSQQREKEARKRSEEEARKRQEEARGQRSEKEPRKQTEGQAFNKRQEKNRKRREKQEKLKLEKKLKKQLEEEAMIRLEEHLRRLGEARRRVEEANRRLEEFRIQKFLQEKEARRLKRQAMVTSIFLTTLKLICIPFTNKTVRWMTLYGVSCYYFPKLRHFVLYWPLRLIFCTRIGMAGVSCGLLWFPITIYNRSRKKNRGI